MKANFEDLCVKDKILVSLKRLLNEWNQELDDVTEAEKRTAKGKSMVATFKQCARYLNPLFKFRRKKKRLQKLREEEKHESEAKALRQKQRGQQNEPNTNSSSNPNSKPRSSNPKPDLLLSRPNP
ncbi:unnamed protein product [Ilex paraguariensis]|uniref:Pre-mRNA-splicing factor 18 n=1 Tax=Ilex paraguariensis TaxID=185542 RepID=A0ABC8RQF3_9AQUA